MQSDERSDHVWFTTSLLSECTHQEATTTECDTQGKFDQSKQTRQRRQNSTSNVGVHYPLFVFYMEEAAVEQHRHIITSPFGGRGQHRGRTLVQVNGSQKGKDMYTHMCDSKSDGDNGFIQVYSAGNDGYLLRHFAFCT